MGGSSARGNTSTPRVGRTEGWSPAPQGATKSRLQIGSPSHTLSEQGERGRITRHVMRQSSRGPLLWRSRRRSLPVSYDVTVRFEDSRGRRFELPYALDLDVYFGTMFMTIYGMYDAGPRARPGRVVAVLRSGRLPRP